MAQPEMPPAGPVQEHRPQGEAPHNSPKKLSSFLKVSIILLAALTVASIALVFLGDFDGKFERVFSTFCLFAVFVTFTALDTSRDKRSEWYAPVALIANAYILGLLLLVIWMTPYDPFLLGWEIFWKSVLVILVVRAVILGAELLLRIGEGLPGSVTSFAFVTSILAVLSGILFTAPVGIDAFQVTIPELYWKIATSTLILTALGLAITTLLRWSYGADRRAQKRAERRASSGMVGASPYQLGGGAYAGSPYAGQAHSTPAYPAQAEPAAAWTQQAPVGAAQPDGVAAGTQGQPAPAAGQQAQVTDDTTQLPAQEEELLPWPTFEDGTPLPMGPDGQPDFSVLEGRQPPQQ